jgi:hypothetical protein
MRRYAMYLTRRATLVGIATLVSLSITRPVLSADYITAAPPLPGDTVYAPKPVDEVIFPEAEELIRFNGLDVATVVRVAQQLRDAAVIGTWAELLAAANWPVEVYYGSGHRSVTTVSQFPFPLTAPIPMELRKVIVGQTISTLLINSEGLMYGDGQLWLGVHCPGGKCETEKLGIITLNLP